MKTSTHPMLSDAEEYDAMAKHYKNYKRYTNDAEKLLKDGWLPEEVSPRVRRAPWWAWICIGPFALFAVRKDLTVRYSRIRVRPGYIRCFNCGTVNRATQNKFPCTNCSVELKR